MELSRAHVHQSQSEKEAHLEFALDSFQSLWVDTWSIKEDAQLRQDEYVKVVKKLLTIDLTTCFIRLPDYPSTRPSSFLHYLPSFFNSEFVDSLEHLSKESDPLSQQAIMHVLSSTDQAVGHRRSQSPFGMYLPDRLDPKDYLEKLYNRSTNSNQRKSDEVTQALNNLQLDLERWPKEWGNRALPRGWSSYIRPILDYIRQNDL